MTILSGRHYDVLVAQRANPYVEIQTPTDAAWALRQSCQGFELPYAGEVDEAFIEFARESMARDIQNGLRVGCAQPHPEITHDQYWQAVMQIAAQMRRPGIDTANVTENHPFARDEDRAADVHRHTAHPNAMDDQNLWWSRGLDEEVSVMQFLKDSARASLYADAFDQAHSLVPHYRPNGVVLENHRVCLTKDNDRYYPCVLRRLDDFEDTSYGNDANDSVAFRIGDQYYHLFIGPDLDELREAAYDRIRADGFDTLEEALGLPEDARPEEVDARLLEDREFLRFQLQRGRDPEEAYQALEILLETDSEAELLRVIGDEMVRARRRALRMAP